MELWWDKRRMDNFEQASQRLKTKIILVASEQENCACSANDFDAITYANESAAGDSDSRRIVWKTSKPSILVFDYVVCDNLDKQWKEKHSQLNHNYTKVRIALRAIYIQSAKGANGYSKR